jgi:hypothetical protein
MSPPRVQRRVQRRVLHQQRRLLRHLVHWLQEGVFVDTAVGGGQGRESVNYAPPVSGATRTAECVKKDVWKGEYRYVRSIWRGCRSKGGECLRTYTCS